MTSNSRIGPAPVAPLLSMRRIAVAYGATKALVDASLDIRPGEIHALVGNHSEGKSSLCLVLAGLLKPDSGEIRFGAASHRQLTLKQAAGLGVEFVEKSPTLFPYLTVAENITVSECRRFGRFWHLPGRSVDQVARWLKDNRVDIPPDVPLADVPPEERNFIQILSRLYGNPNLLILDETLEFLPSSLFSLSVSLLEKYRAGGMAVLWVTHQLDAAIKHADTLSVLRYGKIVSTEDASGIDRKDLIRRAYLDAFGEADPGGFLEFVRNTEAVLRDLPLAIFIVNPQGKLQYVNNEAEGLFPGGSRAGIGDDVAVLLGEGNEALHGIVRQAIGSSGEMDSQIISLNAAGGKSLVSAQTRLVRDKGELVGAMVVVQDVDEQEKMRRQLMLKHNLSSIGLLAAGVAHEVNNPLEILGNYLHYLKKNPNSAMVGELTADMESEVDSIRRIIRNLMSFSGRTSENRNLVDLQALIQELSSLIRLGAGGGETSIVCHGGDGKAIVRADAGEIRQILLNLIRNSIEAMPNGGEIVVDIVVDDRVWLVFRDNGCGIRFDSINDIFLPFSSTKTSTGNNQGLGLSIVHGLVEKHAGVISVNNLDVGCEFVLSFPLADARIESERIL